MQYSWLVPTFVERNDYSTDRVCCDGERAEGDKGNERQRIVLERDEGLGNLRDVFHTFSLHGGCDGTTLQRRQDCF